MNIISRNFEKRNIEFEYFKDRDSLIKSLISEVRGYNSIGIGNSQTLKKLSVSELMISLNKDVFDKTLAETAKEIKEQKKKALTSDCYISSCNALTRDGKIINVDHSGNRVAAITYGPERVLLIVGSNKLTNNESEGVNRALKVATPKNAKRAKINSPCSNGGSCAKCTQDVRVCNYVSIIRGQHEKGRMKIMMLEEEMGF